MTGVIDMTVSGIKFCCDWMLTYEVRVYRRRMIAADYVENDW